MLIIRLQRTGSRNNPDFRLVLAEKQRAAGKKSLETFGQYDPKTKVLNLSNKDLLLSWVAKNVEISPTVRNLLINQKLIEGQKVKAWRPKKKAPSAASAAAPAKPSESAPAEKAGDQPAAETPKPAAA